MTAVRFLFLADCQLGCYATFSGVSDEQIANFAARGMKVRKVPATDGWDWDAARYRDAIAVANELRPDFVVMGGDMIDDPTVPGQLDDVLSITEGLDPSIPMHWVPGNHDIAFDTVNPTDESIAFYADAFGADHFSFEHGDTSFIVIDTVVLDRPAKVREHLDAQMSWLETALVESSSRSGATVVFGHHPLFLTDPAEPDVYWNVPVEQRMPVLELMAEHGVSAYFSGHRHLCDTTTYRGVELVTSGAVGFPLGDDPCGYRIVDVTGDSVEHGYYGLSDQGWPA